MNDSQPDKLMDFKTVFVIDPVKGDRLHLAKLIKQSHLFIMSFVALNDCVKQIKALNCQLIILVLRKEKLEIKHLLQIKKKYRDLHYVLMLTADTPEVNLSELRDKEFESIHKASDYDKVREITYTLLWPEGLPVDQEVSNDPLAQVSGLNSMK
ncbi:MAG: hypothetical protein COV67_09975 [Nitrospinae bacterium CG11_big_fil_rev_8_21_14_0_20_56_8]|nr:MAG: hypothetical protein COV67_09975 [Nitrospinae bacterium CG11_big_fil_rev_8_21_14_0_20_56_8]